MSFQIQYTSIIITYFVTKMQTFFSFAFCYKKQYIFFYVFFFLLVFSIFFFLLLYYFLQLFITINFSFSLLFFIFIIFFIEHAYFMPNIWIYCINHPKKPTNILCFKCGYCKNHSNKINVYFVTLMQVFHIELYIFEVFLVQ